ncbi:alpha-ribazole phosphatase [Solitalea lacus]|uniref:alpha-ribazole phosphatase n=1 Tax=Solitalea lacus TaxID=2911172 RepID=UPI001EDC887C|nr:alpha-ribazole phosphatase [Solitalea lacus]UKJ06290.1 alpha-ribazole phosphatase [Solitalea lacus]
MDIYLIRHTEVNIAKGICYGQSDLDVLQDSVQQTSEQLSLLLPQNKTLYSSPLKRCKTLASHLTNQVLFDDRLMEMNFGDWELQDWNNINQAELNPWMEDFVNIQVPNGESFVQLHGRTVDFINELINNQEKQIVIITHAGVIRSWLCEVLGIPLKNAFKLAIDYGSVSKLSFNYNHWSVQFINNKLS